MSCTSLDQKIMFICDELKEGQEEVGGWCLVKHDKHYVGDKRFLEETFHFREFITTALIVGALSQSSQ